MKEPRKHLNQSELKIYKAEILNAAKKSYSENELYCFSEARAQKEQNVKSRGQAIFEADLDYLNRGLTQKGRMKNYENYALGRWITGDGEGTPLHNAITGEELGRASSQGLDFDKMMTQKKQNYIPRDTNEKK